MNRKRRSRATVCLAGMAAAMAAAALHAAPALATAGSGEAAINVASHSKGKTLSGQGVKLLAGQGASGTGGKLTLPIAELDPGAQASARTAGTLRFKRGKKALALTGIRFELSTATLVGKLGGVEMPVFRLGGTPAVNGVAGSIGLSESQLKLTEEAASALERKLGLTKALRNDGVGMLWLSAQANPALTPAKPVVSGSASWGFSARWREYIYKNLGPGSVGSITTEGGATTVGEPALAGSYFVFPAVSGSFQQGLYGAADRALVKTAGSVKFAKPGHCINEIRFTNLIVTLDGASSSIYGDVNYDIDKFNGMACEDEPPVSMGSQQLATVTAGGGTGTYSANAVTLAGIPTQLGAIQPIFGSAYKIGEAINPLTLALGLG